MPPENSVSSVGRSIQEKAADIAVRIKAYEKSLAEKLYIPTQTEAE